MKIGFAVRPVVSKSNSLSPKQKREHEHAWRQSQHYPKKHGLNRRHRRPQAFDFADLSAHILVTLGAHRGGNVAAEALLPRNPLSFAAGDPRIPTEERTPVKLISENELY
jgi:hypothetical protein